MLPFHDPAHRFRSAPTIETERLLLRGIELRDLDYFERALSDPQVTEHIGGPNNRENAYRKMMTGCAFWTLTGIGMWAVEDKASGRAIGHMGFFDFLRDLQPSILGEPEMGWIFASDGQGRGLAREACEAALDWFEQAFGKQEIPAIIALGNEPSMRLAERLGFVRQPDALFNGQPTSYWRRPVDAKPA